MIRTLLTEDKSIVLYRPRLRSIGGSVAGTVLLQQIIYWDSKANGKFYKFAAPCDNSMYKPGDSWEEELGITPKELRTALSNFAFKLGKKNKALYGDQYEDKKNKALVLYYTDSQRITYYLLNRQLLDKCLMGVYKGSDQVEFTINTETTQETTHIVGTDVPPVTIDERAMKLAEIIAESRERLCPTAKNVSSVNRSKTLAQWASDIEKVHRIDGREWDDIESVLSWALNDSFWEPNIQSGSKFRQQYDNLKIKMVRVAPHRQVNPFNGPTL
jgi:hypothetical protein